MDKITAKIIEMLSLAESDKDELALASLRMATRLAGGSLAGWIEAQVIKAGNAPGAGESSGVSEIDKLKEEIEWLGQMLRARNEAIRNLKKELAAFQKDKPEFFDDKEPARLEIRRLKAELDDTRKALALLTNFMDDLFKGLPRPDASFPSSSPQS